MKLAKRIALIPIPVACFVAVGQIWHNDESPAFLWMFFLTANVVVIGPMMMFLIERPTPFEVAVVRALWRQLDGVVLAVFAGGIFACLTLPHRVVPYAITASVLAAGIFRLLSAAGIVRRMGAQ